jgi:four helix bundle protein
MAITTYRDLDVYQRSIKVLVAIHKLVLTFPDYERFDLCDQMRRASKSIPANIAEGYGRRRSVRDFKHYLAMALGSANEMVVHLNKIAKIMQ